MSESDCFFWLPFEYQTKTAPSSRTSLLDIIQVDSSVSETNCIFSQCTEYFFLLILASSVLWVKIYAYELFDLFSLNGRWRKEIIFSWYLHLFTIFHPVHYLFVGCFCVWPRRKNQLFNKKTRIILQAMDHNKPRFALYSTNKENKVSFMCRRNANLLFVFKKGKIFGCV